MAKRAGTICLAVFTGGFALTFKNVRSWWDGAKTKKEVVYLKRDTVSSTDNLGSRIWEPSSTQKIEDSTNIQSSTLYYYTTHGRAADMPYLNSFMRDHFPNAKALSNPEKLSQNDGPVLFFDSVRTRYDAYEIANELFDKVKEKTGKPAICILIAYEECHWGTTDHHKELPSALKDALLRNKMETTPESEGCTVNARCIAGLYGKPKGSTGLEDDTSLGKVILRNEDKLKIDILHAIREIYSQDS